MAHPKTGLLSLQRGVSEQIEDEIENPFCGNVKQTILSQQSLPNNACSIATVHGFSTINHLYVDAGESVQQGR